MNRVRANECRNRQCLSVSVHFRLAKLVSPHSTFRKKQILREKRLTNQDKWVSLWYFGDVLPAAAPGETLRRPAIIDLINNKSSKSSLNPLRAS